jgi:hypothetical protein
MNHLTRHVLYEKYNKKEAAENLFVWFLDYNSIIIDSKCIKESYFLKDNTLFMTYFKDDNRFMVNYSLVRFVFTDYNLSDMVFYNYLMNKYLNLIGNHVKGGWNLKT